MFYANTIANFYLAYVSRNCVNWNEALNHTYANEDSGETTCYVIESMNTGMIDMARYEKYLCKNTWAKNARLYNISISKRESK